MNRRDYDEDDVRVRPGRGSRPRTRQRPKHEDASSAFVIAVDRGRYTCRLDDGTEVTAIRGGSMRRTAVVVGDRVAVVGDVSGSADLLARIVRVEPRTSVLLRSPDDTDPVERPVVANADALVIVAALADPPPRPRLIDRCLVAAYDGGLEPILCFTKRDLVDSAPLPAAYRALDLPIFVTSPDADDAGAAALRSAVAGRTSVFFGHSGVGKSTLVNRFVPGAARATGEVSAVGKGRHVSSSAVALALPGGGWVIDTPGIRSFGLGHVTVEHLLRAFPDLQPVTEECLPGCTHAADEPGCALDAAVGAGEVTAERVASLRRLLASRLGRDEEAEPAGEPDTEGPASA